MEQPKNLTEPHSLETVSEQGKAPTERLSTSGRRRSLAALLIKNDRARNRFDTRVKAMVDGASPYEASKLKKHAQSWRCNVSFGEGKAAVSAAMTPFYDLLSASKHYANVKLKLEDPQVSSDKSDVVTEEWDRMLREEESLEFNLMLAMNDRLRYGKGFLTWDDEWEPCVKWVNRFNAHVPDRAKACIDELEVLVIEDDIQVHRLYEMIHKPGATEAGWKIDECNKALRRVSPSEKDETNRQDLVHNQYADRDILDGQQSATVQAAHVYVKEFTGKISHYIVELEGAAVNGSYTVDELKPSDDLFKHVGQFENWHRCFWATFHEPGDGSRNGASGLGKDILPLMGIKNRLRCTAVDNIFMRSGINLRATTEAGFGKVALIQQGPVTVYPPGYEILNVAGFVGDVEGSLALDESMNRVIGKNTGIYQQVPEKNQGNPLTATGEMLRQQHSAVLTNSSVSRFYRDLDRLWTEMYRRTVNAPSVARSKRVKEFIARCEARNVTIKDLQRVDYVRAQRNSGNGSLVMRQQNLAQLASLVPLFPPKGQEEWVRDSVSSLTNFDAASRYAPKLEAGEDITHHHQIAQLENDSLAHGSPVIFSPQDNHVIHAQVHLQTATGAVQSLEQGADPNTVLAGLDGIMPHANMHIVALEGNPARQNEAKMLRGQWNQLAKTTDELRKNVQKIQEQQAKAQETQMRAQAIQQGQDPEWQLKAAEQQADLQLRAQKTAVLLQQKQQKDAHGMALADQKTASEIKLNAARTMAEIQQAQLKTVTEVENNKQKAKAGKSEEK